MTRPRSSTAESCLIAPHLLKPFLTESQEDGTPAPLLQAFIREQCAHWPALAAARELLSGVHQRVLHLEDLTVTLQHNPGRIRSATARTDSAAVRARPCFLCPENLYPQQKGLAYRDDWMVLNNPFPIFPDHLVIVSRRHVPQRLGDDLGVMAAFVREHAREWTVFYNGPACGASAPDHLHFQACPARAIPVVPQVRHLLRAGGGLLRPCGPHTCWSGSLDNRGVFVCTAREPEGLCRWLRAAIAHLEAAVPGPDEPLLNLIVSGYGDDLLGILFPRRAHRPDCFYARDEAALLVSPGAVDVGGLVVVPHEHDFERIDARCMRDIYRQVCLGPELFAGLRLV